MSKKRIGIISPILNYEERARFFSEIEKCGGTPHDFYFKFSEEVLIVYVDIDIGNYEKFISFFFPNNRNCKIK